mgnify:CR=1 FL=1
MTVADNAHLQHIKLAFENARSYHFAHNDLLLGRDELNIIWKLRRALSGLDDQSALETLKSRMAKTANNHDFLLSVLKTTPAQEG